MRNLICPISPMRVNENVARVTASLVVAVVTLYVYSGNILFILLLGLDFAIRAFTSLKVSPLSWLAIQINKLLRLPVMLTGKAKKIFAARVGALFALAMLVFFFVHPPTSIALGLVLMAFALLEAAFNICVGCLVYTYLVFPMLNPVPVKPHA
jgi:hypothetical protein